MRHLPRFKPFMLAGVLTVFGFMGQASQAADVKERTLKLPVVTAIDHPLGIGAVRFGERVEKKSGGKIKARAAAKR